MDKGCRRFNHCHKLENTRYFAMHGCPPWSIVVATKATPVPPNSNTSPLDSFGPPAPFHDFFKWYEKHQTSSSTTFIAHIGTTLIGLTRSTSLSPRVLGYDVTITSQKMDFKLNLIKPVCKITFALTYIIIWSYL